MVKRKNNVSFFVIFEITCVALLIWMIVSGINFTFYKEYPNAMNLFRVSHNTLFQNHSIETRPNESITYYTIRKKEVSNFLNRTGFLESCQSLSNTDFSVAYTNDSILMINLKNYTVECDYVK